LKKIIFIEMSNIFLYKKGFFSVFEITNNNKKVYQIDSGKTIYSEKYKKYYINKNRIIKEFKTIIDAEKYINKITTKTLKIKENKLKKIPKSLYLILMKEEVTGLTFVKVGITSKKLIRGRFSKQYGYIGYELLEILRRVNSEFSEKLEDKIKTILYKKITIKKYRPVLKKFSGYSECFNIDNLNEIINVFDNVVNETKK
jgi:hypothetical protein